MDYWMMAAAFIAYVVKGMCGFANTLIFGTILSFHTDNINITPVEVIVGYPSNVLIAYKERREISAGVWLPLAVLVMAGSIPGTLLLKTGDAALIKIIFGAVVTGIAAEMFLRERKSGKQKTSQLFLGIIGIVSGVLCGLFGIGALLAAYVSRTTDNNRAFRGNLCMVFIVENTFRLIVYSVTGIFTAEILRTAVILMPFMLGGLGTGILLSRIVSEQKVRKLIIAMLALSGVSLILKNIL